MSGTYDVTCYGCAGRRVVPVLNRDRMAPELLKRIDDHRREQAQYRAEERYQRRMGF